MNNSNDLQRWPAGGGQCAALLQTLDWAATDLGAPSAWHADLRMLVDTILSSPVAMALMWGERGILLYNDAYSAITGAHHPAAFGKPVAEACTAIAESAPGAITKVLTGQTVSIRDQRVVIKRNGVDQEAWFDVDYSAVRDSQGHPRGTLAVAVETARHALRESEETLRQLQKMETVGQLTRVVAHDFNNLLQGIVGPLELVRKFISLGRSGETERFIDSAMSSTRRAAALTHRLLAFSNHRPPEPKPVQVNELIAAMDDLLRRSVKSTMKIQSVLAADLWLTVCDANQFEHAILNLVLNARDAMADGGTIIIQTANADLDASAENIAPGQYVSIAVTDSGQGMNHEMVQRVAASFLAPRPDGAGLGLSMVNRIARNSHGCLKISSEPGRGTSVILYLPRYRGDEARQTDA